MIYIKPTEEFLQKAKENDYYLLVTIRDADDRYNNADTVATISPSTNTPNDRPNFFEETGYYVITLGGWWLGYPKNLGKVEIHLTPPTEKENEQEQIQPSKEKEETIEENETDTILGFSTCKLVWIFVIIAILFIYFNYGK